MKKNRAAPAGAQRRTNPRRVKRARPSLGLVIAEDAAFFARFPGRSYRVRPAAPVEVAQFTAVEGLPAVPPEGCQWVAIVHQVRLGLRFRQFMLGCGPTVDRDAGEDHARALWEAAAPPGGERDRITMLAREFGL